jgi:ABC-type cobalt transport system substrate-binding protein
LTLPAGLAIVKNYKKSLTINRIYVFSQKKGKIMKKVFVCVAIVVFICSCASTQKKLLTLTTGMAQEQVTTVMGVPERSELYESADGSMVSILYYLTEDKGAAIMTLKDECTPLVLINGQLVGWGERLIDSNINQLRVKTK